jgi:dTDP-4-dehydrorhamnose reductase
MTRYLVSGASGLLGANFCLKMSGQGEVLGISNQHPVKQAPFNNIQKDLCQPGVFEEIVKNYNPDVVIHCAAMANIDECENDQELVWKINTLLPGEIARITKNEGIRLIHISTDAVFDGSRGCYTEDDSPNPLNSYARSKLAAEHLVFKENPEAIIARVNFYGWSIRGTRSLAEWFVNNLSAHRQIKGFTDVYFCPLFVGDLVDILVKMVTRNLKGIYHVVSSECTSKYLFGVSLARQFGYDENLIIPTSWKDGGLVSVRSPDLRMRVEKLVGDLGEDIPGQQEGIHRFYREERAGIPKLLRSMG